MTIFGVLFGDLYVYVYVYVDLEMRKEGVAGFRKSKSCVNCLLCR